MMNNKEKSDMPYSKFFCDGLTPEMKLAAKEELGETEEVIAQGLKELKSLIKREPDFRPLMDDKFLLRFLRGKKYDTEKAFKKLQSYYCYKAKYSGIITDFKPSDIKHVLDVREMCALEYRNSNYIGIGYIRLSGFENISPDDLNACCMVLAEVGMEPEPTQVFGYTILVDCANISLRLIKKYASPSFAYRCITGMQEYLPVRVRSIHIVNEPFYYNILVTIFKSFMTEKISKRIYLHGSNLKSLHKYISPDILPVELGGKRGPISEIIDRYNERVLIREDHVMKVNKYGYQGETLRQLTKDNPHAIIT